MMQAGMQLGRRTLTFRHECFELKAPFRIARGTKTQADVVVAEIGVSGTTGRGEGVPYARYGESIESCLAQLEGVRTSLEAGAGREVLMSQLPPGAARNAVDCALWDLEARLTGSSISSLVGLTPGNINNATTIVLDRPDAMALAASGLPDDALLKIKVDSTRPEACIKAVRNAAPNAEMIVDPNESWDEQLLRGIMPVLQQCGVALLEQPVPADEDAWLEGFSSAVPICADESIHVEGDLSKIARRYSAVNVKLDKTGGLTTALGLVTAARSMNLKVMSGCMVCSSLSIAPALYIAAQADWTDLDGAMWLRSDHEGGVQYRDGQILPPSAGFWGGAQASTPNANF